MNMIKLLEIKVVIRKSILFQKWNPYEICDSQQVSICNQGNFFMYYMDLNKPIPSLIRLLSLFEYILEDSGSAENKEELLFSHDKLSLASILRPLHQVTKEMLV